MEKYISIQFQKGPVKAAGVNGCQASDVIDVLVAYLQDCNKALPCRETSLAITKLEEARLWLDERTRRRQAEAVEGTNAPHN